MQRTRPAPVRARRTSYTAWWDSSPSDARAAPITVSVSAVVGITGILADCLERIKTGRRPPGRRSPEQGGGRVVEHPGDVGEEHRAELAVDQPVVERQRELGDLPDCELAVDDPRHRPHLAEAQDRRLAGVDDRRPGVD